MLSVLKGLGEVLNRMNLSRVGGELVGYVLFDPELDRVEVGSNNVGLRERNVDIYFDSCHCVDHLTLSFRHNYSVP